MAFPQTFDTFTTKNAGDTISQTHVNDLQTAVVSIEQKLGTSSTSLTASTNTALLGQGASVTGYAVIRLDNASLVQGTLTAARGGTGQTNTNTANGAVILDASSALPAVVVNGIKAWVNFRGTGTIAINDSYNVSSLVDGGPGLYGVVWDTDFANMSYSAIAISTTGQTYLSALDITSATVYTTTSAGDITDASIVCVIAIGDQ